MDISALFAALPGNVAQGIIWGIMALGVFFTFRILDFADLTVDGSFATGGAVAAMLITGGYSVPVALIAATVSGVAAGIVTGLLHTKLGIPGILASILTQISLYSINLNIMKGMANVAINGNKYNLIVSLRYIPQAILISAIFAVVIIIAAYWYFGTEQGSAVRATGSNPNMSQAQGININAMKVLTLGISNGVVALAGGLIAQYQGFADINMGRGAIVIGLAAVIIGEVVGHAIFGKRMNFMIKMVCVVCGGVIYYIVIGIVLWLRMPTNNLKLFTAIIVAIFLAVPYLKGKANNSFRKAAKRGGSN
ncbi:MAG: ABC transporter permease [Lachnospiraceae bacterium]|nr:ABC transporter permease [Lachnospiraceae bacterium]